jgi:NADH:ubiquinone oxidoreductase subunit F (NADH-binding)
MGVAEERPGRAAAAPVSADGRSCANAPRGAAAERARRSFFADLRADDAGLRVCRGTSCELAGAAELERAVALRAPCRPVYCLGHCDRSPVLLRPDGQEGVQLRASDLDVFLTAPRQPEPPAVSIRCAAREPVVTARIARGDHARLDAAERAGVWHGLARALRQPPEALVDEIERSGERGRGGAGFPTGRKWRACAETRADARYAIANGDEGDPGSFVDRVLLEWDPHAVLEGLALCGYAIGARHGIVYVRSEYPRALERVRRAVDEARAAGILGERVLGSSFAFDVEIASGHGSYVCGEETALLAALEGRRGEPRVRPPYPAQTGLGGRPTVVNNVETLVNVAWIAGHGGEAYASLGTPGSRGTKAICLNHGFARPGIVELEFGASLRDAIERHGGGARAGTRLAAVWLGGPMGSVVAPEDWDLPLDYDALHESGVELGHGGLVALPRGADLEALWRHALEFVAAESCGKCAPCALGSREALAIARGEQGSAGRARVSSLLALMRQTSLCAFGRNTPRPLAGLLRLLEGGA